LLKKKMWEKRTRDVILACKTGKKKKKQKKNKKNKKKQKKTSGKGGRILRGKRSVSLWDGGKLGGTETSKRWKDRVSRLVLWGR